MSNQKIKHPNCNYKLQKGKRLWKKMKYELVEYDCLPDYLKDNEYIKGHYRANWPLKEAFFSIFSLHNETLNVWTHLIGFFVFLCLTIYTAKQVPNVVDLYSTPHLPDVIRRTDMCDLHNESKTSLPSMDILPITRWPFYAFLVGAMFCLLASSTCHLLSCHSERLSYIMLRLDYAGIASLISTSFYPLVYYSFLCHPFFRNIYIGFITLLAIATFIFSLLPAFQKPELRTIRAILFSGMGLSGILPILHKNILYWDKPAALHSTGYELLMGLCYCLGALVYATRIPERWLPGKFDIAGHSHQLFHILVVAGAYSHYRAGLVYLQWRDLEGC